MAMLGPLAAIVLAACGASAARSDDQLDRDYFDAGLRAQQAGNLTEAAADYRKALAHNPSDKFAYFDLGLINQQAGNNDAAEKIYRAALQIDPNFVSALFNLAIIRTPVDAQETEQLYRHVIALQPGAAGPHLNLGFLLRSLGRTDEAKAEFARALVLDASVAARIPADSRTAAAPSH
jgi:tetratricopeptide (TPR) repeat protein